LHPAGQRAPTTRSICAGISPSPKPAFKTAAFDRSATSPRGRSTCYASPWLLMQARPGLMQASPGMLGAGKSDDAHGDETIPRRSHARQKRRRRLGCGGLRAPPREALAPGGVEDVSLTVKHPLRGQLEVYLESPSGTRSRLVHRYSGPGAAGGIGSWATSGRSSPGPSGATRSGARSPEATGSGSWSTPSPDRWETWGRSSSSSAWEGSMRAADRHALCEPPRARRLLNLILS
jgi:hypothetical protein